MSQSATTTNVFVHALRASLIEAWKIVPPAILSSDQARLLQLAVSYLDLYSSKTLLTLSESQELEILVGPVIHRLRTLSDPETKANGPGLEHELTDELVALQKHLFDHVILREPSSGTHEPQTALANPVAPVNGQPHATRLELENLRNELMPQLRLAVSTFKALQMEMANQKEEMKREVAALQAARASLVAENETARQSVTQHLDQFMEQERSRVNGVLTDQHAQFEALVGSTNVDAAKFIAEMAVNREGTVEIIKGLTDEASTHLQSLKDFDKQASTLLGIIGTKATSSGFMMEAEASRTSMNRWNTIAVTSLALMTAWACALLFVPSLQNSSLSGIVGRIAVATPLLLLAGYAAAQAAHARKVEQQLRRTALELAAFPAFMAPLPKEKSHELFSLMAQRTFGREVGAEKPGDAAPALLDTVVNKDMSPLLLQLLLESLKKKDKP